MRMLLRVSLPVEAGNAAAKAGTLGPTIERILALHAVTPAMLDQAMADLAGTKKTPQTILHYLKFLRHVFRWAKGGHDSSRLRKRRSCARQWVNPMTVGFGWRFSRA